MAKMCNKILYILRGVSGSGKSTLGAMIAPHVISADDYFMKDGKYHFNPKKLGEAHAMCQDRVKIRMEHGDGPIAVCNTFTQEWEMKPYEDLADEHGHAVFYLVVENRHGNSDVHNVPDEVKQKQERNLRNSLKLS